MSVKSVEEYAEHDQKTAVVKTAYGLLTPSQMVRTYISLNRMKAC